MRTVRLPVLILAALTLAGPLHAQDSNITMPVAELERICEEGGLPFARIQTPSALFDDPHLNAGGMVPLTLPDGKKTQIPGLPMQFGAQRLPLRSELPVPGEHNAEILGGLK